MAPFVEQQAQNKATFSVRYHILVEQTSRTPCCSYFKIAFNLFTPF